MERDPTGRELQLQIDELSRRISEVVRGSERMAEKLAEQYRQDKAAANEWRTTANDFMAIIRGQKSAISGGWSAIISLISAVIAVYAVLK